MTCYYEEVLIQRTISQIKAERLYDLHCRQSSNNIDNCTLLGYYAASYHYSLRNKPQKNVFLIYFTAEAWNHSNNFINYEDCIIRASAHQRLEPRRFFFSAEMKRVLNTSERTVGCFTAAFFQTQQGSFFGGAVAPQRLSVALEH
jgi:hypothetical protein